MGCLYILEINPLPAVSFAFIFSHSEGCFFTLFIVSFVVQKLLSLIRSHLFFFLFFFFNFHSFGRWVTEDLEEISAYVSSMSFIISSLIFRSLNHFEFIFVYGGRKFHSFTCSCPVLPAPLMEETIFSPLYILTSFVKDKVPTGVWVYLWAFYLIQYNSIPEKNQPNQKVGKISKQTLFQRRHTNG